MSLVGVPLIVKTFSFVIQTANTPTQLLPPSGYPHIAYNHITIINQSSSSIYIGDKSNQPLLIPTNGSYSIDIHYPNEIDITSENI